MSVSVWSLKLSDGRMYSLSGHDRLCEWVSQFSKCLGLSLRRIRPSDDVHNLKFSVLESYIKQRDSRLAGADKLFLDNRFWMQRNWHDRITNIELDLEKMKEKNVEFIYMLNSFMPIFSDCVWSGGGPFHAAYASLAGNGILIAGPGNIGKSTSLRRLPDYYKKFTDDAVLLVKNKKDCYRIHPVPTWSDYIFKGKGTSVKVESSNPLKAIFFLLQANEDEVVPIKNVFALHEIINSYKQPWNRFLKSMKIKEKKDLNHKILNNSVNLLKSIPCYYLKATLHGKFWKEIEMVLMH